MPSHRSQPRIEIDVEGVAKLAEGEAVPVRAVVVSLQPCTHPVRVLPFPAPEEIGAGKVQGSVDRLHGRRRKVADLGTLTGLVAIDVAGERHSVVAGGPPIRPEASL